MIFETWRSYFISWQMFKNKVWCPVSRKIRRYFHFLLSLAYPIDRLDWALFSVVILFRHLFPLLEKGEIRVFILPRNFPAVLIIFTGRGGAGNPLLPTTRGGEPPLPRRAWRPSLIYMDSSIWLLSVIAILVRSPKLMAPFPDLSRTTDFNYKSRDVVESVSLDVGEVVADQSCPMFALAAKPNMCTTSRLAAKPNPCFPPSLVKGVEGGTHWDFWKKKR